MSEPKGIDIIITKVFDSFRKISPALIAVTIVSGIVLFAPKAFLDKLGLASLPDNIIMAIGILFLLFTALIITILLSYFSEWLRKRKILREKINDCHMLNENQKLLMKKMLSSTEKAAYLKAIDGDTVFLESKGILCRPTQSADYDMISRNIYKYCPQPWVIELWPKNPKLFD